MYVRCELFVEPECVEVRAGASEQSLLPPFRELHRPFETAHERGARQVRATYVRGAKASLALEYPGLCVEAGATPVQRDPDFAAVQAREVVKRLHLGGAGVCGGENANLGPVVTRGAGGGHASQYIDQLSNATDGDEADENVDLVAGGGLASEFVEERWRALAGGE